MTEKSFENEKKLNINGKKTKEKCVRFSLIFSPLGKRREFSYIDEFARVTLVTYNPICSKVEWQKLHECLALKGLICARLMLSGFFSDIS